MSRRHPTGRAVIATACLLATVAVAPSAIASEPKNIPTTVATAATTTTNSTGQLPDGATWTIDLPANWNGTLLLFSHGLVPPGAPNPAVDAPDPLTADHLLGAGFALA